MAWRNVSFIKILHEGFDITLKRNKSLFHTLWILPIVSVLSYFLTSFPIFCVISAISLSFFYPYLSGTTLIVCENKLGRIPFSYFISFAISTMIVPIAIFSPIHYLPNTTNTIIDSFYFSATTFATLGLGDFTPKSGLAKVMVAIETILGYLYLGMIVSFAMRTISHISITAEAEKTEMAFETKEAKVKTEPSTESNNGKNRSKEES